MAAAMPTRRVDTSGGPPPLQRRKKPQQIALLIATATVLCCLLAITINANWSAERILRVELAAVVGGLLFDTTRRMTRQRGKKKAEPITRLSAMLLIFGLTLGIVHVWVETPANAGRAVWKLLLPLAGMTIIGIIAGNVQRNGDREREEKWYYQAMERKKLEEKRAISLVNELDRNLAAREVVRREHHVLDTLFEMLGGEAGAKVSLADLAHNSRLDIGRTKSVIDRLRADGAVSVTAAYDKGYYNWTWGDRKLPLTEWTDQEVELTKKGRERIQRHHDSAGKAGAVSHKYEFNAPVTTGFIGSDNKVRKIKVTGKVEGGEAFQSLLESVRSVQANVRDPHQAAALRDELEVLEGDTGEPEKTAAVQRLVGMSRMLGSVADPILDAANKLKDLLA